LGPVLVAVSCSHLYMLWGKREIIRH
jgi:hypothetical protein